MRRFMAKLFFAGCCLRRPSAKRRSHAKLSVSRRVLVQRDLEFQVVGVSELDGILGHATSSGV
jgi:hypothetical protein